MTLQDHLATCSYCREPSQPQKPTIRIKSASSRLREKKMAELGALVSGISYPGVLFVSEQKKAKTTIKAASSITWIEKSQKLRELGKLIKG